MMIKKLTTSVALVCVLASALFAAQLRAEQSKIAVVDWPRAVLYTEKAKAKLEELQNQPDFKASTDQFKNLAKEYQEAAKKLEKDRALMSQQKLEEEAKRLMDKQKDLQYLEGKLQQSGQEFVEQVIKEFGPEAEEVLKAVIKEQNIGLLLRRGGQVLLHADASYDITELVVERFNEAK